MANVPFGEMLDSNGPVQASFPAFNAAIGAYNRQQWTVMSLKDPKGDIESVMMNPLKARLIRLTAGKHVHALRTWLEDMKLRAQSLALAPVDCDQTKLLHLIVVFEWTAIEGKAATDDRVGSIVPILKIAANWLKFKCQSEAQFQTQCSATSKRSIAHIIRDHQVPAQNTSKLTGCCLM
jgi:hypothetical protein